MLNTTQKFPMIALAGAISFLATLAAFTAMTSPARADSQLSDLPPTNLPRPGFADPYNKTPIVGYTAGPSHIRLANMRDEGTVTNYISIWGQDEKAWLGRVQVEVPAKASVTIQPHLMLQTFAPVNWSQPIVLYVENGREKQLWQHVRNNEHTGRIEDASVCTHSPHQDYIPAQQVVLNAQINRVGPRHSLVLLHNFSEQDAVFEARMYDAATGANLGKLDIPLAARESFSETAFALLDQSDQVRVQATAYPDALNIEFVQKAPQDGARVVVAHALHDYTTGDGTNLSNPCPIHSGMITIPPLPNPQ